MPNNPVLTVSQLNRFVKSLLEGDMRLKDLYLKGEISNFVNHTKSNHFYFTLKEGGSNVKAVMFSSYADTLRFDPENGMSVIVRCGVSLFERDGSFQIYVYDMQPQGKGDLQVAFEQLYRKLESQGYFDTEKKRQIPKYPNRIGILTSATGAALQDILSILNRRYPLAVAVFFPALVQGEEAPDSLIRGLRALNRYGKCDVLIVGRGGGSMEDLWAFNDPALVEAIALSQTPVISAVGHETDFTLCDYASDLRAPTPSAAAELAVPNTEDVRYSLSSLNVRIENNLQEIITNHQKQLKQLLLRDCFRTPKQSLEKHSKRLDYITKSMEASVKNKLSVKREQLRSRIAAVDNLNPLSRLSGGYSITSAMTGKILTSASQVVVGEEIQTKLGSGELYSTVYRIVTDCDGGESTNG